jgi:hypothetical protein
VTPSPRPDRPPARLLAVAAAIVAISGAALVAVPSAGGVDSGLSPHTVARHLAAAAPPGARDVRISGVYGSGHRGTWQFTGFITWRDAAGTLQGGGTELPQNGGQPTVDLDVSAERIATEHAIGWTERRTARALSGVHDIDAELAMVSLEILPGVVTVVGCSAASTSTPARCATFDDRGRVTRSFTDRLVEHAGQDAISVQRESAPIGTLF